MRNINPTVIMASMIVFGVLIGAGCAPRGPVDRGDDMEARHRERLVHAGKSTFEAVCASCHGLDGGGNGPVAAMLVVRPSDLTTLSVQYDGRFPTAELRDIVFVHRVIPAHGTQDLPVWGDIWSEEGAWPRRRDIIEYEIDALIEYIRTIQRASD